MEKLSQPKMALITGATYGIGYELARQFADHQYNLILVARTADKLDEVAKSLEKNYPIKCETFICDLTVSADLERLCSHLKSARIDVLVNNAGFGDWGPFQKRDWKKNSDLIELNVKALTQLTHFFLQGMVERGVGKILNVASTAGFQPMPNFNVYAATKAFVIHFSEALAEEVRDQGVTVTVLCPGPTETRFKDVAEMSSSRVFQSWSVSNPEEVAKFGFSALMRGETIAIPGALNKALMQANRLVPRFLAAKIAKKIQGNPNR